MTGAEEPRAAPRGPAGIVGSRAWALAMVALAVGVRIWAVHHARFDRDEAWAWTRGLDIAEGHGIPGLGPPLSSAEASTPGPLLFLVTALFQLPSTHPLAGSLGFALLGVLGLWLMHRAVAEAWDRVAGGVFLALGASSPWLVYHGDRIWTPNLFVPLCAATVWCLLRLWRDPKSPSAALLVFLLLVGFQIHLPSLHLWSLALAVLLVRRPRPRLRWLLLGIAMALGAYLPYLVHETRTGFANTRALLTLRPPRERSVSAALGLLWQFFGFGTTDVSFLVAAGYWGGFDPISFWRGPGLEATTRFYRECGAPLVLWVSHVSSWALLAGGLIRGVRRVREAGLRARPLELLYGTAMLSILLLYVVSGRGLFVHYASMLLPLALLPPTLALAAGSHRLRIPAGAALFLLMAAGLLVTRGYYRRDSLYSMPQQEQVIAFVLGETGDRRPFELRFGWPRGNGYSYLLLARRRLGARWLVSEAADDVFTVVPRAQTEEVAPPGRVVSVRVLDTLAVIHSRREAH